MSKIVIAKNLVLGYKNEIIIEGGGFSLNSGDFVFLTGASGSGKTTLIRSLYGELKPKSGYLNIGSFDMIKISKSKLMQLRRHIGIVFQDYKLIKEWTIERNVRLPLTIAGISEDVQEELVTDYLSKVKLAHLADKYPYELSGGEQQRAAIIRAIINRPVLILADEPTGNLDDYSSSLVMDLFRVAHELEITIMIATHHLPDTFDIPYRHLHIEGKKIYEVS
jgi:cell division transport system ATP-binding protein